MPVDENTAKGIEGEGRREREARKSGDGQEEMAKERTRLLVNANDTKCPLRNGLSAEKIALPTFESGKMRFNVRLYSFGCTGHRQYYFRR